MSSEIAPLQASGIVKQELSLVEMVQQTITRGDVAPENVPALLDKFYDFQMKMRGVENEMAFNRAFAALQQELPRVKKNGAINLGGREIKFAKWEDADEVLRPLLARHGFTLSFPTHIQDGKLIMSCTLTHESGHSKTSEEEVTPDLGPGRNTHQAMRSGRSYKKRGLAFDMLNIVTEGEDNDGKTADPITQEQADEINSLISEIGMDPDAKKRFLKFAEASCVSKIQKHNYDRVIAALERKRGQA